MNRMAAIVGASTRALSKLVGFLYVLRLTKDATSEGY